MRIRKRNSKAAGLTLLIVSILAFITYAYFLIATELGAIILRLTVLGAVAALLSVLAWIGYAMATAPKTEEGE